MWHQFKVFNSVVLFVSVNVMYILVFGHVPSEMFLHYENMLGNIEAFAVGAWVSFGSDLDVAVAVDCFAATPVIVLRSLLITLFPCTLLSSPLMPLPKKEVSVSISCRDC